MSLLSGILIVDKPAGMTSHDVVNRVRKSLAMKKVGHAGTLDPFATGLLTILVGEGTKLSDHLMASEKVYRTSLKLGTATDTGDPTGSVVCERPSGHVTEAAIIETMARFTGAIVQIPPMYSALKKDGVPLYKLAREGVEVKREGREVFIRRLSLLGFDGETIDFEATCTKGTYVRTLASDMAEDLGTCGHLTALRRTRCGFFTIEQGLTLDDLADPRRVKDALIPLCSALPDMGEIVVNGGVVEKIGHGNSLKAGWVERYNPARPVREERRPKQVKVMSPDGRLLSIIEPSLDPDAWSDLPGESILGRSVRVFSGR